jgi:Mrp family chromosome partitioning ATPase
VDVQGLSIMSAGRRSDTATELLASQRMHAVCASLLAREPSRIVVIDSPPLLLTNESRVLATAVGQVVMVVRAGTTSQQNVMSALGFLDARKHAIGLVLNQSMNPSTSYSYYGYGDDQPGSSVVQ